MNEQMDNSPNTAAFTFQEYRRRILIVGRDQQLLRIRAWVMEKGAFETLITTNLEEAKTTIAERAIDGLVLCHSLPEKEAKSIVQRATIDRPNLPILLLTSSAPQFPLAVEAFDVNKGPRALLTKCSQLFGPASVQGAGY
jgi:DNA-binding NtrC family response regulator